MDHAGPDVKSDNDPFRPRVQDVPSERPVTSFRLWLEVGDVMSKEVISVCPDETVVSAAKIMSDRGISCIVVGKHKEVLGILTETDFLKKIADKQKDFGDTRVRDVMSSPVASVPYETSILEAGRIMEQKHIKRLPIVKENQLVGIVTQTDLVRALTSYGMWRDVAEIMTRNVAGVPGDATVAEAAELMTRRNVSCVVTLEDDQAVGVLTERDLLTRVVARKKDPAKVKMKEVMTSPVTSVAPSCSVFSAGRMMEEMNVRRLIVADKKHCCGIVAQTDIFRVVKKKLEEDETENLELLEKSESNIYTNDLDGITTYVNPALVKLLELSGPEELVNQPFLPERFWCNPKERIPLSRELERGSVKTKELALKTARGKRIHITLFSTFTKNIHGEINGSQGVFYDITAKKELVTLRKAEEAIRQHAAALESANQALVQANIAAQAATRAKNEFLANMSHELRTPMTAILGHTDLLIDEDVSNEERDSHAKVICRNGQLLLELLNSVLDLSKIEAGGMVVEQTDCSLCELVDDVVWSMRPRAAEKGLNLQVDYAYPLQKTVQTDPTRLRQILLNLVDNAIKFTEQGCVRITVRSTQGSRGEPRMQFAVADTGIGMTGEQKNRIFQPFVQADSSTTRRFGGTGLGLTISKRMAELLGGGIEVESELGKGSTFTVTVDPGPLAGVPVLTAPPRASADQRKPATVCPVQKLQGRVLLAEDGPDNRRLIRFILEKAGLQVDLAENGRIACEKTHAAESQGKPYDLIVMDMQMPELDGYEATRRLRQDGCCRPIIALTAHAMAGDRERCLEAGCDDYAAKPINRAELLTLIAGYLQGDREPVPTVRTAAAED